MSIAQEMKATADLKRKKEEDNPEFLANKALKGLLDEIESQAKRGLYEHIYLYNGPHWRRVHEELNTSLIIEGFNVVLKDNGMFIYWDKPKDRVTDKLSSLV